jgi:hypothetical protein
MASRSRAGDRGDPAGVLIFAEIVGERPVRP